MMRRAVRLALTPHAIREKKAQHSGTENNAEQRKKIFHDMLLLRLKIARVAGTRKGTGKLRLPGSAVSSGGVD